MTTHSDDFDRDGDQQSAYSEDEKERILRDARATVARSDDQEIPPRVLDQPFGDDERRSIFHRANCLLVGHKTRDVDDRAWTEDEKAEIIADARANIRRDAATGMIKKVRQDALVEVEAPPRQPRQRYQRRRRADSDDALETMSWPEPSEDKLDASLEDLITARVEKLFSQQHKYIFGVVAQAIADTVEPDGVVAHAIERERRQHRLEVRKLQARIDSLEKALDELRDAVALEKSRSIVLPALPVRRDLN